ncbi:MAG: T9SS type A sorting domain-containing protein, partial [Bacteroidales bacterium]|nr:T9SS type A sorting domain-containing protein [Bacteroidales bacterium]
IEYGFDYNWNLGILVSTELGEKNINQKPVSKFPGTISKRSVVNSEQTNNYFKKYGLNQPKIFEGFNVYYAHNSGSFDIIASGIMEPNYLIVNPESGWHEYFITASANSVESGPSNTIEFWVPYTDINNTDEQNFVEIYPIPTSNSININSVDCIYEISIYSTIGERVLNKKANSNNIKLDVSSFKCGIYLLLIQTERGTTSRRIVIQ